MRSTAPEKIHGCRSRDDFSRPGASTSAGPMAMPAPGDRVTARAS
jgi:hypothetical protein